MIIREMQLKDYQQVSQLWHKIDGFGIRSLDDSQEGVERFLKRNPGISMVSEWNGSVIGALLCGHDGRTGCMYHVCVLKEYRESGVGNKMVNAALQALKKEGINRVNLIAFKKNKVGNHFWKKMKWKLRDDVNYYDFYLNDRNTTVFIKEEMEESVWI